MKSKHYLLLGVILLVGIAAVLVVAYMRPASYQGSLIDPPLPAPEFQLTDQNGAPASLSDVRGEDNKVVLIFFGYTHCPDVCPTTLANFKQVKTSLGQKADEVAFVFITVDPERDTVEEIEPYLRRFDPSFMGLTGTRTQLEPVWKDYFVYQDRQENVEEYLVDHSGYVYAIDQAGEPAPDLPVWQQPPGSGAGCFQFIERERMNSQQVFRRGISRFAIILIISVALVTLVSEVAYRLQKGNNDRAPQVVQLVIPQGTAQDLADGKPQVTFPEELARPARAAGQRPADPHAGGVRSVTP